MNTDQTTTKELSEKFDELMDLLQEQMATKEDMKVFATKNDLAVFKLDISDRMDAKLLELKNDLIGKFLSATA